MSKFKFSVVHGTSIPGRFIRTRNRSEVDFEEKVKRCGNRFAPSIPR